MNISHELITVFRLSCRIERILKRETRSIVLLDGFGYSNPRNKTFQL